MLIVMAGLPATGKTSLAAAIARASAGVVLSKDEIRAAAFPPQVLDYSSAQDDLCMEMLYGAARYTCRTFPGTPVIVDGRTFTRRANVDRVIAVAEDIGARVRFVECVCDDATARRRLEESARGGTHVAANRDWSLYARLRSRAEPLQVERVTVDTGALSLEQATAVCMDHLFGAQTGS